MERGWVPKKRHFIPKVSISPPIIWLLMLWMPRAMVAVVALILRDLVQHFYTTSSAGQAGNWLAVALVDFAA